MSTLFKPPQLQMKVKLKNGTEENYRIPSKMIESGFFISPMVTNVADFGLLATGHYRSLADKRVLSFSIAPVAGKSALWSTSYQLRLKTYKRMSSVDILPNLAPQTIGSPPAGYILGELVETDGAIDRVNKVAPNGKNIHASELLKLNGWLAIPPKKGNIPGEVFITLTDETGTTTYNKATRVPRVDVSRYYKLADETKLGFEAITDLTGLEGNYLLGLAIAYEGMVHLT